MHGPQGGAWVQRCGRAGAWEPGWEELRPHMVPWGHRGEVGAPNNSGRALSPWAPAQPAATQSPLPVLTHWAR